LRALACQGQHLFGQVNSGDALVRGVVRQGEAGADPDLQHIAAGKSVRRLCGLAPAEAGDTAERDIVDARPAPVRGLDGVGVQWGPGSGPVGW
jgi:hypothetical protein